MQILRRRQRRAARIASLPDYVVVTGCGGASGATCGTGSGAIGMTIQLTM
jgi:hypothetical protein